MVQSRQPLLRSTYLLSAGKSARSPFENNNNNIYFPFVHLCYVFFLICTIFLQQLQWLFGPKGGHGLEHEVHPVNR